MRNDSPARLAKLSEGFVTKCKKLNLMDTDLGKAVVRIRATGFSADLHGLDLTKKPEFTWRQEALVEAIAAFKRAQSKIFSPDCDGDTYEWEDLNAVERALDLID